MDSYITDINRIKALLAYAVLDTPPDEFYDTLNNLVSTICKTPISLISFIDDERQWYKSKIGMDVEELPVEETICQYSLKEEDVLEISDTLQDDRLVNNPHVQAENGIRFYAGIRLRSEDGYAIGSVCAADFHPQQLNEMQRQSLRDVAKMIEIHLGTKLRNEKMEDELKAVLEEKTRVSEEKIRLQKQIYNNLFEAISQSNAIIEFSKDGTILNVNQQYADMVGYSVDELIGSKHEILVAEADDLLLWDQLAEGVPYTGKFKRKTKAGEIIYVHASYSPVIDLKGDIERITNISVDITKDVQAVNALEELSNQKDNFIANISHELRSPIHAIIGFTELLLEQEENIKKYKQLHSVKTAGDSLLYLVNGILDLSKIEAGLFQFDKQEFRLNETIENVFSILQGKTEAKNLSFSFVIAPEVPDFLNGDKNRLSQVLINLIDNSIKFTERGEVKLSVKVESKSAEKVRLHFIVSDTGIGIASDKLESVFGRFTQAESNTTRKYGGTGLGLNICKLLVEKQGGTIGVRSVPNEKTEFYFSVDFDVVAQNNVADEFISDEDYSTLTGNVLMCEDNVLNIFLAKQLFATTNIHLDIAKNGKEGIDLFRKNEYDLVLMDIQMPEMDGYQTTDLIRNELKSTIPIIAITAHSIVKEKDKCFEVGMNDYLSKPFKKNELFEKIKAFITPVNDTKVQDQIEFSLEIIKEASQGNKSFEIQMMNMLLDQSDEVLKMIKKLHEIQDWEGIAKQAHQLKSTFGMFQINIENLTDLEYNIDKSGSLTQIDRLEEQILQVRRHVRQLLSDF